MPAIVVIGAQCTVPDPEQSLLSLHQPRLDLFLMNEALIFPPEVFFTPHTFPGQSSWDSWPLAATATEIGVTFPAGNFELPHPVKQLEPDWSRDWSKVTLLVWGKQGSQDLSLQAWRVSAGWHKGVQPPGTWNGYIVYSSHHKNAPNKMSQTVSLHCWCLRS